MPETNTIKHQIQGTFASEGFLANGYFSGWFSYSLNTPDINTSVANIGQFEIFEFQIDVFDANSNLIDTLNESNSNARISLQDTGFLNEQADIYILSTTSKTAGNDFFEHGEFHLIFEWPIGGNPNLAPEQPPRAFREAYFSSYAAAGGWEGVVNPQQVELAYIEEKISPITLGLQGSFANTGFLANGSFEGWFVYDSNAVDLNESITNVGSFDLDDFKISVFDAAGNLVNTLDDTNSTGQVSLRDINPVDEAADTYFLSIIPDTATNSNAFFERGELNIAFDWALGGDPNIAPVFIPQVFEVGNFASYANAGGWEGVFNPQQVQAATISLFDFDNFALKPIRVEAETMELVGYRIEDSRFASGKKLASLFSRASNETGSAVMKFSAPPGKYTVVVGYVEENDGEATLEVVQNGSSLGIWQLITQGQGRAGVTANNSLRHTVATELSIQYGDEFTILGIEEGAEHARVDYIEFIPVVASEDTAIPAIENGLNATYFSDRDLQTPALNRIDTTIDFLWGNSSPDPTLPKNNFSVRWSGYIASEYSEAYEFSTSSDDGVRLWVGDDLLIDNWTRHAQTIDRGYIDLEAGKMYPVTLEYFEGMGQAISQLSWSSKSQELEIIPQDHLFVSNGLDTSTVVI